MKRPSPPYVVQIKKFSIRTPFKGPKKFDPQFAFFWNKGWQIMIIAFMWLYVKNIQSTKNPLGGQLLLSSHLPFSWR